MYIIILLHENHLLMVTLIHQQAGKRDCGGGDEFIRVQSPRYLTETESFRRRRSVMTTLAAYCEANELQSRVVSTTGTASTLVD